MPKCLDATRVSEASIRPAKPAGQEADLFSRSLSLPYFNRIGCHGPCGMTLVFCSLRHYTGPHSVFSVGWLLPPQPHPCHSFPLHPACRLPASLPRYLVEPQASLTRSLAATAPQAHHSLGRSRRPKQEKHQQRPRAASPWLRRQRQGSMGLWACHYTRIQDVTTPHACEATARPASQPAASVQCPRSTFCNGPVFRPRHSFRRPREPISSPVLARTCPWSRVYHAQDTPTRLLCSGVSIYLHALHYMLIEDALEVPDRLTEHDRHECSSISASILKPPLPTLSQHRSPTNDPAISPRSPVFLPAANPGHPTVHTLRHGR